MTMKNDLAIFFSGITKINSFSVFFVTASALFSFWFSSSKSYTLEFHSLVLVASVWSSTFITRTCFLISSLCLLSFSKVIKGDIKVLVDTPLVGLNSV